MRFRIIDDMKPDRLEMLPEIKVTSEMRRQAQRLADNWLRNYGDDPGRNFNYIGGGSFRSAYRRGDFVYKIGQIDQEWYGDNLSESRFAKLLRQDGWGWFVPDIRTIAVRGSSEYNVNVMHFFNARASDWEIHPLAHSLRVMLSMEYNYGDASIHNLLTRRDNGMPVLVDAGIMTNRYKSLDEREAA